MGGVKVLRASAGSGKTFSLAYEYVAAVVADPAAYRHILAVTFTNKATEEMKHRIMKEIDLLARGAAEGAENGTVSACGAGPVGERDDERLRSTGRRPGRGARSPNRPEPGGPVSAYLPLLAADPRVGLDEAAIRRRALEARSNILHDYSRFAVLTIDKFFQRIIRSFLHELGIEQSFTLELRTDTIVEGAADELIEDISADPALRRWVTGFVEERIDNNRRWNIAAELAGLGGEIFSDGFHALQISKEELYSIVSQAVARAEAVKAKMRGVAIEALELIAGAGLAPTDFAYGANGFTSYLVAVATGEAKPYGRRVADALEDDTKWYTAKSPYKELITGLIPHVRPLLAELCALWDDNARLIATADILRENYRSFALLSDLSRKVEELCTRRNIMPIAQTNNIIRRLVENNDAPFIFEKSAGRFSRFMIDEFQDTSLVQWQNFLPLLRDAVAQSEGEPVLLVGDVKQSIYRWRGGDWKILARDVRRSFGRVEERSLDRNFRSLRNIVEFNNELVAGCIERDNEALNCRLAEAAAKGLIAEALRDELTDMLRDAYADLRQIPREDAPGGHITVTHYAVDREEVEEGAAHESESMPPVIERVCALQQQGYRPGDIAILVRSKREGRRLVEHFMEHKQRLAAGAGDGTTASQHDDVCLDVVTQEALQIGFARVAGFVIAAMKLSVDPTDPIARTIYNRWLDDGKAGAEKGTESACEARRAAPSPQPVMDDEAFLRRVGLLSPVEAFEAIVERYSLGADPTDVAYLQALEQQAINFCLTSVADTALFVQWWKESGAVESINLPGDSPAITIITIHKAKGLQYPAVIVPFCDWSLNPGKETVLWADLSGSPYGAIGTMPVKYRTALGESHMAADYFRELVYSHIDNINILYVALTRACEELHIMMRRREKPSAGASLVSALVRAVVPADGETVKVGSLEGRAATTDSADGCGERDGERLRSTANRHKAEGRRACSDGRGAKEEGEARSTSPTPVAPDNITIAFGEPCRPARREDAPEAIAPRFVSASPRARLRLRLQSQRYFEEDGAGEFSPRRMGILLHRVFEQSGDREQVREGVRRLALDGAVSAVEAQQLDAAIVQAFSDPVVGEWFSGRWREVRNESDIITSRGAHGQSDSQTGGALRRPDRVMIGESGFGGAGAGRCVVVDYKFGMQKLPAHARQIEDYTDLLRNMGYGDVRGYIWYISLGEVVAV